MLRLSWRFTRSAPFRSCNGDHLRHYTFGANDLVLLRQTNDRSAAPILSRPLKEGKRIETHHGIIHHDEIIGKSVRDVVEAHKKTGWKTAYRIHQPKLEEYVRLTRRLVTPIYPADASLIVDLLDLCIDVPGDEATVGKIEILEAGTGHGALTLYLSRAIHGANQRCASDDDAQISEWKQGRRAVIHSVDKSAKYSEHAQSIVRGFRHGMYFNNVDFYAGDVSDVLRDQLQPPHEGQPFLSHAFLDLPSADTHLSAVASALKVDGTLIVFNPSITQITDCALRIKDESVPLELEKVVELGVNGTSGGREWDVRMIRPRAVQGVASSDSNAETANIDASGIGDSETLTRQDDESAECDSQSSRDVEQIHTDISITASGNTKVRDENWRMVCRPKVGDRIVGGGFLGVWRKQR